MIAGVFVAQGFVIPSPWVYQTITIAALFLSFFYAWQEKKHLADSAIAELQQIKKRRELKASLRGLWAQGLQILERTESAEIQNLEYQKQLSEWGLKISDFFVEHDMADEWLVFTSEKKHLPRAYSPCGELKNAIGNLNDIIEKLPND